MSEIFSSKKRTELRSEYCIANGYSHFNDRILNDYTDYLELRLMEALNKANGDNTSDSGLHLQNVSRCFSSKEQLSKHITTHIPFAVKPIKKAKTTFVNPFTSNNARQIVEDAIVECLLNNG